MVSTDFSDGETEAQRGEPAPQRPPRRLFSPACSPAPLPERRRPALPAARAVVVQSPLDVLSDQLRLSITPSGHDPYPPTARPGGSPDRFLSSAPDQVQSSLTHCAHARPRPKLTPRPLDCPCLRPLPQPRRPRPDGTSPLDHTHSHPSSGCSPRPSLPCSVHVLSELLASVSILPSRSFSTLRSICPQIPLPPRIPLQVAPPPLALTPPLPHTMPPVLEAPPRWRSGSGLRPVSAPPPESAGSQPCPGLRPRPRFAHLQTQTLEEVHVGLRALGLLAHEQQQ